MVLKAPFWLFISCKEVREKARRKIKSSGQLSFGKPHLTNCTLFTALLGNLYPYTLWSLSGLWESCPDPSSICSSPNPKSSSGQGTKQDPGPRTSNGWMSWRPRSKCLCYSWSSKLSTQAGHCKLYLFILCAHLRICLEIWRDGRSERNIYIRERYSCLMYSPCPGLELSTLWCTGQHLTQLSHSSHTNLVRFLNASCLSTSYGQIN